MDYKLSKMDYELAKQLKDAGFTFKQRAMDGHSFPPLVHDLPTLEELIDACVYPQVDCHDFTLNLRNDTWEAQITTDKFYIVGGDTPTNAVANLFLEINQ